MTALLQFADTAVPWVVILAVTLIGIICGLHRRMMAQAYRKARREGLIDGHISKENGVPRWIMLRRFDNGEGG